MRRRPAMEPVARQLQSWLKAKGKNQFKLGAKDGETRLESCSLFINMSLFWYRTAGVRVLPYSLNRWDFMLPFRFRSKIPVVYPFCRGVRLPPLS